MKYRIRTPEGVVEGEMGGGNISYKEPDGLMNHCYLFQQTLRAMGFKRVDSPGHLVGFREYAVVHNPTGPVEILIGSATYGEYSYWEFGLGGSLQATGVAL